MFRKMFGKIFRKKITVQEFLHAAYNGSLDVVQQYIDENKNDVEAINAADEYGNTALILAAFRGRAAIVTALLAVPGIAIDTVDELGNTALILAADYCHDAIVTALLAVSNIPINAANVCRMTALILLVGWGNPDTVAALLAVSGIDIDAVGEDGKTALHCAVAKGHDDTVTALLEAITDKMLAKDEAIRDAIALVPCASASTNGLFGTSPKSQLVDVEMDVVVKPVAAKESLLSSSFQANKIN